MNGYAKITIQGKEVGLKFNYSSLKPFLVALYENQELYREGDTFTQLGWAKLFHCGYTLNCAIKEVKPSLAVSDFYDWLEGLRSDEQVKQDFTKAVEVWFLSQDTQDVVKKINGLYGEKKSEVEQSPSVPTS